MKTKKTRAQNKLYPLFIAILFILLAISAYLNRLRFLELMELKTIDLRFVYRGKVTTSSQVVIADIDEKSLDREGRWPWPRSKMAQLVTRISDSGAKVLAFDIGFFEPDRKEAIHTLAEIKKKAEHLNIVNTDFYDQLDRLRIETDYDKRLAESISKAKSKIVLGQFFHMNQSDIAHIKPSEIAAAQRNARSAAYQSVQIASGASINFPLHEKITAALPEANIDAISNATEYTGYFNMEPDFDGVLRWMKAAIKYNNDFYAPLALKALSAYYDEGLFLKVEDFGISKITLGDKLIPTDNLGQIMVNYRGYEQAFKRISATDILNGDFSPELLKDKIVLCGVTVTAVYDLRVTPFGVQPGLLIHADLIDSILQNDFLFHPPGYEMYSILAIIMIGLILGFVLPRTGAVWGLLSALSLSFAYYLFCQFLFNRFGVVLNLVYPISVLVIIYISITAYRYLMEEGQKRFIRNAFSTYLAPSVVKQLVESPEKLVLGGEQREITAFFSDIQGFTSISEKLSPTELVELLNEFLTEMTEIIKKYEGTVDKFEGDAIIAFFGAPQDLPNHAERAVLACIDMQKRMAQLRKTWRRKNIPELKMRIGLYTGMAVVGNMGSKTRMDYTMMGDSVNTAARLEGVNKTYGIYTLIGETTYQSVQKNIFAREIDAITVVGKQKPVKIYQPFDLKDATESTTERLVDVYSKGLASYRNQEWDQAIVNFKSALDIMPEDRPSMIMLKRSEAYKKNPPGDGWNGSYTMLTK